MFVRGNVEPDTREKCVYINFQSDASGEGSRFHKFNLRKLPNTKTVGRTC